jgi:hypothetical protein
MSTTVTLSRNFPELDKLELTTIEDMREIGLLAREQILARTLSGMDADGAAFAPYSEGYAERKRAQLGTSAVNLQVSGNMLNHLGIVKVEADSVTLGWNQ